MKAAVVSEPTSPARSRSSPAATAASARKRRSASRAPGAHVVIAARNPDEGRGRGRRDRDAAPTRAAASRRSRSTSRRSRRCARSPTRSARKHDRLDILLNNAGLVLRKRVETVDGHESQFQINHLGHFLLTNLLHGALVRSAPARVVNVSSYAHTQVRGGLDFDDLDWERRRYQGFGCYSATKLMNVLFTRELARRNDPDVLTANALHPGFVASNFAREGDLGLLGTIVMPLARPFAISQEKGALTSIYLVDVTRRRRHHRPVLRQGQGGEARRAPRSTTTPRCASGRSARS